jgi:hypothetical protein
MSIRQELSKPRNGFVEQQIVEQLRIFPHPASRDQIVDQDAHVDAEKERSKLSARE